jgi:hypothetical protein
MHDNQPARLSGADGAGNGFLRAEFFGARGTFIRDDS